MATVTLTAVKDVHVGDVGVSLKAGDVLKFERAASDIPRLKSVAAAIAAGDLTMQVAYSADEKASGIASPPGSVDAADAAPVAADGTIALGQVARKALAAGAGGAADDTTVLTASANLRVVDAWAIITTPVTAATLDIRDATAGAGTLLASLSAATAGVSRLSTSAGSAVLASGKPLVIRRSDSGVAAEVFVLLRSEQ